MAMARGLQVNFYRHDSHLMKHAPIMVEYSNRGLGDKLVSSQPALFCGRSTDISSSPKSVAFPYILFLLQPHEWYDQIRERDKEGDYTEISIFYGEITVFHCLLSKIFLGEITFYMERQTKRVSTNWLNN